jgi:hypothetical protein
MDDYSALAYRIAGGVADVRGCLILSRDGLILGSYPDDETAVKPAWVKFASLGEPERSFVEFGDQVWVFVRRPAYGAFAVADAGVRPGLVIDQLEQMLLSAEEARSRRETLRVPEAGGAPSGKPRTSLHPSAERSEPAASATAIAGGAPGGVAATAASGETSSAASRPWARGDASMLKRAGEVATEEPAANLAGATATVPQAGDAPEVAELAGSAPNAGDDPATGDADTSSEGGAGKPDGPAEDTGKKGRKKAEKEERTLDGSTSANGSGASGEGSSMELDADAVVDPVLLAKEFSGLLQVESGDDEGSS